MAGLALKSHAHGSKSIVTMLGVFRWRMVSAYVQCGLALAQYAPRRLGLKLP